MKKKIKTTIKKTIKKAHPLKGTVDDSGLNVTVKKLPKVKIKSSSGEMIDMAKLKGHITVLYFYPKDLTPGCTVQGLEFNQYLNQFKKMNTLIYGISRDDEKLHNKFIEKHGFKFELLADTEQTLCNHFSVIKEKNMYGKKVMGIERSTFIINEKGEVVREYRKVKAEGHAEFILKQVQQL